MNAVVLAEAIVPRIDSSGYLEAYTVSTKLEASWSLLTTIHGYGREAANSWHDKTYDSIGLKGPVDLRMAYI